METILELLRRESSVWLKNEQFHMGTLETIVGDFMVNQRLFEEAKDILQKDPYEWIHSKNPLLQYGSIGALIKKYVIDHNLAKTFVTSDMLMKNPALLGSYKLNIKDYPVLMKDPVFQENYIKSAIDGEASIDKDMVQVVPFDLCYKLMSRTLNKVFTERQSKGVRAILEFQMQKGPKYLREKIIPLFSGKTSYILKNTLKNIFDNNTVLSRVMLENLPFCLLFHSKDELANVVLDRFKNKIPPAAFDVLFNQFKDKVWGIDLKELKKHNLDGALRLFSASVKAKPYLKVTYKEAIRTKRDTIECDINYRVGAFTFSELSPIMQCYMYFQAKERGIDYLAWLIDIEQCTMVKKNATKTAIIPIATLQEIYDGLSQQLSAHVGHNIDEWLQTQKEIAGAIFDCSKRTDYEKIIVQEFQKVLEQKNGLVSQHHQEFDLLF